MNTTIKGGAFGQSCSTVDEVSMQSQHRTPEYYVDANEAAKFLKIHRRTALQMARDGTIPGHPLGDGRRKLWRFLLSELDEWMRGRLHSGRRPCSPN